MRQDAFILKHARAAFPLLLLAATPAFAPSVNHIATVSPNGAAQGSTKVLVTFALDTDLPAVRVRPRPGPGGSGGNPNPTSLRKERSPTPVKKTSQ
jgi:hypothetical protein